MYGSEMELKKNLSLECHRKAPGASRLRRLLVAVDDITHDVTGTSLGDILVLKKRPDEKTLLVCYRKCGVNALKENISCFFCALYRSYERHFGVNAV